MPAWNLEIIGTYAQTEMGHGNKSGNLPARTLLYWVTGLCWVTNVILYSFPDFVEMLLLHPVCYCIMWTVLYSYHNGKKRVNIKERQTELKNGS